jgi:hypothetical protein
MLSAQNSAGALRRRTRCSRLAVACNRCQEAKGRCDVKRDACTRCQQKGYECITTDPRTGVETARRMTRSGLHQHINGIDLLRARGSSHLSSTGTPDLISQPKDPGFGTNNDTSIQSTPGKSHLPMSVTGIATENDQIEISHSIGLLPPCDRSSTIPSNVSNNDLDVVDKAASETSTIHNVDNETRFVALGFTNMQVLAASWIDRYFTHAGQPFRISSCFKYGMRYAVEGGKDDKHQAPQRQDSETSSFYAKAFYKHIYPIFPVIDQNWIALPEVPRTEDLRVVRLCIYSLGADTVANGITTIGTSFLYEAYAAVTDLLNYPYLSSVQALFLMSLAFRSRAKDGQASLTLALAIKMAQALGLHRNKPPSPSEGKTTSAEFSNAQSILHSRIWWSLYCLDIICAMESGIPRLINDADCNQPVLGMAHCLEHQTQDLYYFHALVDLCKVVSSLEVLRFDASGVESDKRKHILLKMARSHFSLQQWLQGLPMDVKQVSVLYPPTEKSLTYPSRSGVSNCITNETSSKALLMSFYHQWYVCVPRMRSYDIFNHDNSNIIAHRAAITITDKTYQHVVASCAPNNSRESQQLLSIRSQWYESAVELIKIFTLVIENGLKVRLLPISQLSYAIVVLTIWILKCPMSSLQSVDMAVSF